MKVLHVNSYFNGSIFYKNLFDKQVESGLDVKVYVPVPKTSKIIDSDMGDYTKVSPNHGKYDRYIFHLKHNKIYKDIKKSFRAHEFSLCHAHSLFSNGYISLKLKNEYSLPYVVAVRNTDINYFFKKMPHLRKIGIKILTEANAIILLSEAYKKILLEKYVPKDIKNEIENKIYLIPNGIDDFWFENMGSEKDLSITTKLNLLHVGLVSRNKNIETTVKAIDILKEKGYDIKFNVVGRMKNEKMYHAIKDIKFLNYIEPKPQSELLDIYRENDIFVMPSRTETFGLVYAEAMSQGLPVVYSKGQGFDRQFEDGVVGEPVFSNEPLDIAMKIEKIIGNYNGVSNNCIKNVEKFRWDNIIKQYSTVYSKII